MKKIKKILLLGMVFSILFACIACTNSGGSTETTAKNSAAAKEDGTTAADADDNDDVADSDVSLILAMMGDGSQKPTLDALLEKYKEETGISVESIYIAGGWGVYCTKIQTMVGGGDKLDCAIVAIEGIEMFVDMGLAEPIDDYIAANPDVAKAILDDVTPDLLNPFQFDGKTYTFPFSWNNVIMHFNLDRLEEAGLSMPPEDWSKEDFLEYCEKLTGEKDGVKQYAVTVPYDQYFVALAWLYNNNAAFMNDDFTESLINKPESVEIFQLWQDLIYEYGYAPVPEPNVNEIQQMINGQVAMGAWGRWPTNNYIEAEFDQVAVQYLPNFETNKPIYGVDGIFVMKSSDHVDEAKKLAGWISSYDFANEYLSVGNIPALRSLAKDKISDLGIPQNYELFFEDTMPMKAVNAPIQFSECSAIVLRAISEICINQADVQQTLDEAAAEMNDVLSVNK